MRRFRKSLVSLIAVCGLCAAAAPAFGQGLAYLAGISNFGKNKIQYRRFHWQIYHSPHFDVYFYANEEGQLQKVVSLAESAYDQLSREFSYQIKEPTPLIYFATHSAFEQNNVITNFIPESIGAFASPARDRMVLPIDLPEARLLSLIRHELTHIFEYHMLFQGSLSRAMTSRAPQWLMEGLASYMGQDEQPWEKMFLRDAVVNDRVPSIAKNEVHGYFAYRFGHAAFQYMVERWGKEGLRDFLYEYRNTLGPTVDRALRRAFNVSPQEFDRDFRRWLRKKYLPKLVETGEPSDFGKPFRLSEDRTTDLSSPAASPSGDLLTALGVYEGQLRVLLFDAKKRTFIRALTPSYTSKYQYVVSQFFVSGREMGRDMDVSPDGNTVAIFVKRERGRSLMLIDLLNHRIRKIVDTDNLEQQLSPAFSPDGRTLAFSAWKGGHNDIYLYNLDTGAVRNLTNDDLYEGAPVFSPDGKSIVASIVLGGYAKLFRIELDDPGKRIQLTQGEWNDTDAVFSTDGKRIYFSSDHGGINNIYGLDLASGQISQYTNVVTGCYMPTVLRQPDGSEKLVYTGFWKGDFNLYVADSDKPLPGIPPSPAAEKPMSAEKLARFEPPIQVTLDKSNLGPPHSYRLFLEDGGGAVGINTDQTFIGQSYLSFSNYLGTRRLLAVVSSVSSFQNIDLYYSDQSRRLQRSLYVFDNRNYFIGFDYSRNRYVRAVRTFRQTGAIASVAYPFSFYNRVEVGVGYISRTLELPSYVFDPQTQQTNIVFQSVSNNYPIVTASWVGDTASYADYGPISGHRIRLDGRYAPDFGKQHGTLTASVSLDARFYLPVTVRSDLAARLYGAASFGNYPDVYYFGGLDTLRGYPYASFSGDRLFFTNLEFRFPLIDQLRMPILHLSEVRGRIFVDVGGSWYNSLGQSFKFTDPQDKAYRLEDAVASYGWGLTANILGLDFNWDFAKQVSSAFANRVGFEKQGYQTSFWIGTRF